MITQRVFLPAAVAVAVVFAACGGDDPNGAIEAAVVPLSGGVPSSSAPATPPVTTSAAPVVTDATLDSTVAPTEPSSATSTTVSMDPDAIPFPPPGMPLLPETELLIGEPDLQFMRAGGEWTFAIRPPSTLLRLDPPSDGVVALDLGLGAPPEGYVRPAYVGGSIWVLGGAFRDTLVEVDPDAMTELRRFQLDAVHYMDQYQFGPDQPPDELWISTANAVRRIDVVTGEAGEPVDLGAAPWATAVSGDTVLATLPGAAQVALIDGTTGEVDLIDTEPGPSSIVARDGVAWVAHQPTAEISRIDVATGEILSVTDVDIGGAATDVPGLRVTHDSVWVIVLFGGNSRDAALVRLDAQTGDLRSARTIQAVGNTWVVTDDGIWLHYDVSGSIIALDVENFDHGAATALEELATPTATTTTTEARRTLTADELELARVFERSLDPDVPSAELNPGPVRSPLEKVRDDMLDLLSEQAGGEVRVTDVVVDGDIGTVRYDVVGEGDTVLLRGLELVYRRTDGEPPWIVTEESLCAVASGLGIPCPG